MLIRLMPCMYPIHLSLGRLGSLGRKYRYSANCFNTLIVQMYHVSRSHKKPLATKGFIKKLLVENTGVEPVTSCMPCKRSSQLS